MSFDRTNRIIKNKLNNISEDKKEQIRKNPIKFMRLLKAVMKFCPKCRKEISQGGEYWHALCPKCKELYESLK